MNIGIIGCGFIAKKRAESIIELAHTHDLTITIAADINPESAAAFAQQFKCRSTSKWTDVINSDVDAVLVCTINNALANITSEAIKHGKHVLVEKPAGISSKEIQTLIDLHEQYPGVVKVGFNHRFHPLIRDAKKRFLQGEIGDLMWIRAIYGQRGRPGFDKEWRSKKEIAGGGELLDQGVHIIDLALDYMGPAILEYGIPINSFWDMEVEDNAFMILKNRKGKIAQLHASSTEWTNKFLFEVYGTKGLLRLDGLQKNYGNQTLHIRKINPDSWNEKYFRFTEETKTAPEQDKSWCNELAEFVNAIKKGIEPEGNLYDAKATIEIVEKVYRKGGN